MATEPLSKAAPKAFISYSWTSPKHEQWVIELANELVENGVDVILDKWNLREGHDAIQFMESMVTDTSVTKVIIVSDKNYAEKADNRKGGVGTESQIMSPEIYRKADQTKFVAIVSELDDEGEPYLPKFLVSRIYIDMTESRYATNFDQLLRWLHGKPAYVKPPLGKIPEFLSDSRAPSTTKTRSKARRAIDAIETSPATATAVVENYLGSLIDALEEFRIPHETPNFPQAVVDNIEAFLPLRNEFIEFMTASAATPNAELPMILQRFFERAIPFMDRPESLSVYRQWDWDNFVFIVHELFLYSVAILLRYERFSLLQEFLSLHFYIPDENRTEVMKPFTVLHRHTSSLHQKGQEQRRISLRADLLEQRSHSSGIKFAQVMQADFMLFLRSASFTSERGWYPESLLYATFRFRGPFEVFARSESKAYFAKFSRALGWSSKAGLEELVSTYSTNGLGGRYLPRWDFETLDISALANLSKLETRP
ncbi:SEFIR domain-containing protein [Tardiphaga sp. 841_E9_N1_2]|uniref:SEFIR domain-containing protein n=1 Tax=Tardiphaga sp. 841_E9_N1_2 TaxID=3240762 RepID=UPI003F2221ED